MPADGRCKREIATLKGVEQVRIPQLWSALFVQKLLSGNLNQLARHFNSGGADTEQIRAKLLDELADLTAFRLHAEKVLGELYGNAQAYRL